MAIEIISKLLIIILYSFANRLKYSAYSSVTIILSYNLLIVFYNLGGVPWHTQF